VKPDGVEFQRRADDEAGAAAGKREGVTAGYHCGECGHDWTETKTL
jgi:hypothetical protein